MEDTKVVVQSIWRLLTTEEGEIPYFRDYGLSLKKYMQYPLSKATADEIYQYVKGKIEPKKAKTLPDSDDWEK